MTHREDKSARSPPSERLEERLFEALKQKDLEKAKAIICDKDSQLDLNSTDKDDLTPLQHACHIGDVDLAQLLIDNGADINFTNRKDGYTPLMFAAISSKDGIVRLLLERDVDTSATNCVNRTAADMAAFVGQAKIVSIINCWIPYKSSVEPYTRKRDLEEEPRLPTKQLGDILHRYIVYPAYHPVKLILYIREKFELIQYGAKCVYVLDDLCTKAIKPPINDETLSLKYHYISYLLQHCIQACESKNLTNCADSETIDRQAYEKVIDTIVRRLIRNDSPDNSRLVSPQLDRFILDCIFKFPYTQSSIFKTATYALSKLDPSDRHAYLILIQVLNGPRMFGSQPEACVVCRQVGGTKKCSRCKIVFYCDQACQKADWFQHKKSCKSNGQV